MSESYTPNRSPSLEIGLVPKVDEVGAVSSESQLESLVTLARHRNMTNRLLKNTGLDVVSRT
jgi:hypothetical protein